HSAEGGYGPPGLPAPPLKGPPAAPPTRPAVAHALETTPIIAPRGPVRLNAVVDSPIQNVYICKVENVHGTISAVPIKTYAAVQPWGTLPYKTWQVEYATDSTGRPTP